jgi:DNA-binding NtrC family response regulator
MSSAGTRIETQGSARSSAQSKAKLQVLLVEDNPADADLLLDILRLDGFDGATTIVKTVDEFRRRVREEVPDIILADYNLGDWKGVEALDMLHRDGLDIPVIMVTGGLGEVKAVDCIKRGATDCALKDRLGRLSDGLDSLARETPSVVLHDLNLPDSRGAETFRRVLEHSPSVPVVVLSGQDDEGLAIKAVH